MVIIIIIIFTVVVLLLLLLKTFVALKQSAAKCDFNFL